jgi:hypothetical protein
MAKNDFDWKGWLTVGLDIGMGVATGYFWRLQAPDMLVRVVLTIISAVVLYFVVWIPLESIQRKTGRWFLKIVTSPTENVIVLILYVIAPAILVAVL